MDFGTFATALGVVASVASIIASVLVICRNMR